MNDLPWSHVPSRISNGSCIVVRYGGIERCETFSTYEGYKDLHNNKKEIVLTFLFQTHNFTTPSQSIFHFLYRFLDNFIMFLLSTYFTLLVALVAASVTLAINTGPIDYYLSVDFTGSFQTNCSGEGTSFWSCSTRVNLKICILFLLLCCLFGHSHGGDQHARPQSV